MATYSFDGHDWACELSGHLKFLLLQRLNSSLFNRIKTQYLPQGRTSFGLSPIFMRLLITGKLRLLGFTCSVSKQQLTWRQRRQCDVDSCNVDVLFLNESIMQCTGVRHYGVWAVLGLEAQWALSGRQPVLLERLTGLCKSLTSWIISEKPLNSSPHGWITPLMWLVCRSSHYGSARSHAVKILSSGYSKCKAWSFTEGVQLPETWIQINKQSHAERNCNCTVLRFTQRRAW